MVPPRLKHCANYGEMGIRVQSSPLCINTLLTSVNASPSVHRSVATHSATPVGHFHTFGESDDLRCPKKPRRALRLVYDRIEKNMSRCSLQSLFVKP